MISNRIVKTPWGKLNVGFSDSIGGWSVGSDSLLYFLLQKDFWACVGQRDEIPTAYQVWHHSVAFDSAKPCIALNIKAVVVENVDRANLQFYYAG